MKTKENEEDISLCRFLLNVIILLVCLPFIWILIKLHDFKLFKGTTKILTGKNMPCTYWGMRGCVHGMFCRNSETYYYGIKGLIGLEYYREWGADMN